MVPYILSQPYLDANFSYLAADSGAEAGTYGDSTHVARVTVDVRGRITAVSSVLISGAATLSGTVATTDATPATILTIPIATTTTSVITLTIGARRTGGASGTAGDGAGYTLSGAAKNIVGTVSIIGQTVVFTAEDQAGWDVALAVSTTNILVRVTGAAANNVSWTASGQTLVI